MSQVPTDSAAMPVPSGSVDADIPCRKCGYNLRGLPLTGDAPNAARRSASPSMATCCATPTRSLSGRCGAASAISCGERWPSSFLPSLRQFLPPLASSAPTRRSPNFLASLPDYRW